MDVSPTPSRARDLSSSQFLLASLLLISDSSRHRVPFSFFFFFFFWCNYTPFLTIDIDLRSAVGVLGSFTPKRVKLCCMYPEEMLLGTMCGTRRQSLSGYVRSDGQA